MSIALQQPSCRDYARMLAPYLDGELEPATLLDLEGHVTRCSPCREKVELLRAMRGSLKRVVRTPAPSGLRARLHTAMVAAVAHESARVDVREQAQDMATKGRFGGWRTMVPLASAAALALFWGAANRGPVAVGKEAAPGDDLLAELVAEHSEPLPPESTDPRSFDKWVGVPVRPARFEKGGAKLVGGRILPIQQQRAAMLQYVVGSGDETRRVSVLVYNPQNIRINDADLTPRAVGTAQVRVGTSRGYTVAVTQRGGVGYAVASDLDADRSAQLAAMVYDDK
jgi:anti-sigma factor (TIGR02949 family)